jgi:bleomycin hydrolase
MKNIIVLTCAWAMATNVGFAQAPSPYSFKSDKQVSATSVKNQQETGTCWAFSCTSFLESEVLRLNNMAVDLSEMFVVRHIYRQKCENYVRRQGNAQFGEGGLAHDAINAVRAHGVVPENTYPGRKDPEEPFNHSKLEKALKEKCKGFIELGKKGELPTNWLASIDALLDDEFGALPSKFTVDGKPFTAPIYRDYLGIRPNDYVTITSFTHHPFNEPFVLEIPDNFSNGLMYNLPLDDMMRTLQFALQYNYSVEWDADVSNEGFSAKNGLAIVPSQKWAAKTEAQREGTFRLLEPQVKVTQTNRQERFDSQETMDDHLMHITGVETETNSNEKYYRVKNSWGEISELKGYLRVSDAYMRLNTISFLVHKHAIPADISKRLGFVEDSKEGAPRAGEARPPAKIKTIKPQAAPNKAAKADE